MSVLCYSIRTPFYFGGRRGGGMYVDALTGRVAKNVVIKQWNILLIGRVQV